MTSPALDARRAELEVELEEPITVDGLTRIPGRAYSIFQRGRGHRHSTDDLLTAWYALEQVGAIARCLDLGAGIGSVGLAVLAGLPETSALTCVEAQAVSFRFLTENVRANDLSTRVRALHADLRDVGLDERYPLVTGSPPYFRPGAGILPADSQKAHARFELRGDVRDYVRAAVRHLEHGGVFVFCFPWADRDRALAAARDEGLSSIRARDVVPREGLSPLFSLFACREGPSGCEVEPPFVVRDAGGRHTQAMHAVRARFGWPPQPGP